MLKFDDTYPAPNPSTGVLAPHPLEVARSHKHRDNPVLPPYYLGEIDKADKTSFSYTPYYRVELEFGVPKAEQQKIDREAAAKEARKGVKGRQPGKKKSASVAMPKKGKNVGGSLPDGKALVRCLSRLRSRAR